MVKLEGKKGRKRPRERWVCSLEKVVGGWIEGVEGDGEEEGGGGGEELRAHFHEFRRTRREELRNEGEGGRKSVLLEYEEALVTLDRTCGSGGG